MSTLNTASANLNVQSEAINRVAVISFDRMGSLLEAISSCENVTTIAIEDNQAQTYNTHHTIKLSVDPRSLVGLDAIPKFFLIEDPERATGEIEQLDNALEGVDLVIILVELGLYSRYSDTFTLPIFLKHIRTRCSKIVCMTKEPFYFEGVRRRRYGEECLKMLLEDNTTVITLDVNKFLLAIPNDTRFGDVDAIVDAIVTTIACDLIKHLCQSGGWETLSQIVQGSSKPQIYFDITKKAMKPQPQFLYTLFGRCDAPVLIDSMPIMI